MNNVNITLDSNTKAQKAERLLKSKGYKVSVIKAVNEKGKGCMNGIRVNGDKDKICKLLESTGIHCR